MSAEHGTLHVSRTFEGSRMEDECPCPQEPCGFVSIERADPDCPQHYFWRAKTMRRMHAESRCPGERES